MFWFLLHFNNNMLFLPTVHLSSIYHRVPENQEFSLAPTETIVGQSEKIGSPTWGMVFGSKLTKI
jgi:hypothetical protein